MFKVRAYWGLWCEEIKTERVYGMSAPDPLCLSLMYRYTMEPQGTQSRKTVFNSSPPCILKIIPPMKSRISNTTKVSPLSNSTLKNFTILSRIFITPFSPWIMETWCYFKIFFNPIKILTCRWYQGVKISDVTNVTWMGFLRYMFIRQGRSFFDLVINPLEETQKNGLDDLPYVI